MRAQEKGSSLASRIILRCLARNSDRLVSLDYVPDHLRHQLSQLLCHSGRMSGHFLKLLVQGSPTELWLRDCSWLREEVFKESFQNFDPSELTVLRLGTHGHCLPDYVLPATLACSANSLPALTNLLVCGAYQLTDVGLSALVSSVPALRSLILTVCPFVTSLSIITIANSLASVLRVLRLGHCLRLDAMIILPALKKLEKLEDLSVEGIENICDEFIEEFISIHDHNLKELSLAECKEQFDRFFMKIIAEKCPG
ncbi:hypothetical protein L484_027376 [Morus notabilis]|uniref:Uncharacterized protein n=1 Tax=Morus notabilis TaxID=981085 RepID=W9QK66_9ROSA|nr:hypothetical protein L484_027376 [Morus notabilis]